MSQKEKPGSRRPTLFVTGFAASVRAKDLAVHFENYGEIIRCDVPAPAVGRTTRYAFIEYVHEGDADKALEGLNNFEFDGGKLIVEWAKRSPGSRWRPNGAPPPPRSSYDNRDRDRDRERDRDRPRESHDRDYRDRDRDRDRRERDRSRSPRRDYRERDAGGRHRSRSPRDRRSGSGRDPRDDMAMPMRDRERDRRGGNSPPRRSGRDYENGKDDRY